MAYWTCGSGSAWAYQGSVDAPSGLRHRGTLGTGSGLHCAWCIRRQNFGTDGGLLQGCSLSGTSPTGHDGEYSTFGHTWSTGYVRGGNLPPYPPALKLPPPPLLSCRARACLVPTYQCWSICKQGALLLGVDGQSLQRHNPGKRCPAAQGSIPPRTRDSLMSPSGSWKRLGCSVGGTPPWIVETLCRRVPPPPQWWLDVSNVTTRNPADSRRLLRTPTFKLRCWYYSPARCPDQCAWAILRSANSRPQL